MTFVETLLTAPNIPNQSIKKSYEQPKLEVIGDVRSITLGGSKYLSGESGGKNKVTPP